MSVHKRSRGRNRQAAAAARAAVLPPIPTRAWILVEEVESGSNAAGDTYCVLSAHLSESGAQAAEAAWMQEHEGDSAESHAFKGNPDEDDWCERCGCCVRIQEIPVTG